MSVSVPILTFDSLSPRGNADPDRGLVERARHGDQQACRRLFERYAPKVRRIVARYVNEADEIADLVQEIFVRAFLGLRGFDGRSRFFTWLYRIAVNQSLERLGRLRQRRRIEVLEDASDGPGWDPLRAAADTPEESLAAEQVADTVLRAFEGLPTEYREAVQLRDLDGLSYLEIGERLGVPLGTVRTRIFRGREAIARAVEPVRLQGSSGRF